MADLELVHAAQLAVLVLSSLLAADLDMDVFIIYAGCPFGCQDKLLKPPLRIFRIYGIGCGVFGQIDLTSLIHVNCGTVFRHVRVIDPVAGHAFLFHERPYFGKILLQTVVNYSIHKLMSMHQERVYIDQLYLLKIESL